MWQGRVRRGVDYPLVSRRSESTTVVPPFYLVLVIFPTHLPLTHLWYTGTTLILFCPRRFSPLVRFLPTIHSPILLSQAKQQEEGGRKRGWGSGSIAQDAPPFVESDLGAVPAVISTQSYPSMTLYNLFTSRTMYQGWYVTTRIFQQLLHGMV